MMWQDPYDFFREQCLRIAKTALFVVKPLEIMTGLIALEIMDSCLHNSGHDARSVYVCAVCAPFFHCASHIAGLNESKYHEFNIMYLHNWF